MSKVEKVCCSDCRFGGLVAFRSGNYWRSLPFCERLGFYPSTTEFCCRYFEPITFGGELGRVPEENAPLRP